VPLKRISFTLGTRVKGRWTEGKPDETSFMGTAQPATGKILELLPEGKRSSETILVFAPITMEFTAADSEAQRSGDIIVWEGRRYEVQIVRKYASFLLSHWELVASRVL
jgi:hypothetical protein